MNILAHPSPTSLIAQIIITVGAYYALKEGDDDDDYYFLLLESSGRELHLVHSTPLLHRYI